MTRTTLKNKTALVLGADTIVGRAISLQLSREGARTILAGYAHDKLEVLSELIIAKGGSPTIIDHSQGDEVAVDAIRGARDANGHVHIIVNAMAAIESPIDDPGQGARRAMELAVSLAPTLKGRGQLRQITIWPFFAGMPDDRLDIADWHSLVRMKEVQIHPEGSTVPEPEAVKAAAVADVVVALLQCPPGACPTEVTLNPREIKS
ncbi:MAG: hypothetical protein JJU11_16865 [Candidatus Sumerlaeia bacterium]|nr:hypothetical protein [Candidatus Sumerlaeia bacterium]